MRRFYWLNWGWMSFEVVIYRILVRDAPNLLQKLLTWYRRVQRLLRHKFMVRLRLLLDLIAFLEYFNSFQLIFWFNWACNNDLIGYNIDVILFHRRLFILNNRWTLNLTEAVLIVSFGTINFSFFLSFLNVEVFKLKFALARFLNYIELGCIFMILKVRLGFFIIALVFLIEGFSFFLWLHLFQFNLNNFYLFFMFLWLSFDFFFFHRALRYFEWRLRLLFVFVVLSLLFTFPLHFKYYK